MEERYNPQDIEMKWQQHWLDAKVFAADRVDGEKFYILEMFPYPSGNLHMGHISNYSIGDVIARYKRLRGYNVLHPMGWDALGLPAEIAAIQDGIHPRKRTWQNIEAVKKQMIRMGFSYDWDREIATCHEDYYRWNQWFFLQMYKHGLVYKRKSWVNWSPGLKTVLANEQVIDGKCWRTGVPVEQKQIPEWAFRITRYCQELLDGLDQLTDWPDRITIAQRNWIGRSTGAEVHFAVANSTQHIPIYTTRVDTIFGCTYLVMAPEHDLALPLTESSRKAEVEEFVARMKRTSKMERTAEGGIKEGVFTGSYAINPFNQEKVPIWLANFVLAEYGTGAVMSVPAHDQRDFEFARKYGLPIRSVIRPQDGPAWNDAALTAAFTEYGVLYQSGPYNEQSSDMARNKMAADAEKQGFGKATVNFKLRDWGFSRQRYWGTPIPVKYCEKGDIHLVHETELPVCLPEKAILEGEGITPLGRDPEFTQTTCEACPGGKAVRDTETMDTFVDSAWYYARFLSPRDHTQPFDPELAKRWLPVDVYVGGPEHAVMHLLYFRFWHKVMRDLGLVTSDEPVKKLITQGMVVDWSYQDSETNEYIWPNEVVWDENGPEPSVLPPGKKGLPRSPKTGNPLNVQLEKMSKSKRNGVSPDEMAQAYGADTLRLFVLFASPPTKDVEWSETGVKGCYRFLARIWRMFRDHLETLRSAQPFLHVAQGSLPTDAQTRIESLEGAAKKFCRVTHYTIKRVTEDLDERDQFNTAIAALMEFLNELSRVDLSVDPAMPALFRDACEALVLMLAPFAPHVAEELWQTLGHSTMIADRATWPAFHQAALKQDLITMAVQVNGKVRGRIEVSPDLDNDGVIQAAKHTPSVLPHLEGKSIQREIVIPGRIVNIVVQ